MDHHLAATHTLSYALLLQEVGGDHTDVGAARGYVVAKLASIASGSHHRHDPMTLIAKEANQMQPDQAGGTGHEDRTLSSACLRLI
jgi:hypothetical protein